MYGEEADKMIREAERTVYHAQWRIWEELALEQLAATAGLARAPLVPGSEVIQLVTYDGEHLGHVRRDSCAGPGDCWVAVAATKARQPGSYADAGAAAEALARARGKRPGTAR